jgi:phosphotransferase system  glucose/maltose/N-acetylglucosamine-specific IIC component
VQCHGYFRQRQCSMFQTGPPEPGLGRMPIRSDRWISAIGSWYMGIIGTCVAMIASARWKSRARLSELSSPPAAFSSASTAWLQ